MTQTPSTPNFDLCALYWLYTWAINSACLYSSIIVLMKIAIELLKHLHNGQPTNTWFTKLLKLRWALDSFLFQSYSVAFRALDSFLFQSYSVAFRALDSLLFQSYSVAFILDLLSNQEWAPDSLQFQSYIVMVQLSLLSVVKSRMSSGLIDVPELHSWFDSLNWKWALDLLPFQSYDLLSEFRWPYVLYIHG